MPADYSLPRLGTRVLDTLDDMNNWAEKPSERKFDPGEVDVFQLSDESELYAHMNINYLRLDGPLPPYADRWPRLLGPLRGRCSFPPTGEWLNPPLTLGGPQSGADTV